jgi:hypothetical protein
MESNHFFFPLQKSFSTAIIQAISILHLAIVRFLGELVDGYRQPKIMQ